MNLRTADGPASPLLGTLAGVLLGVAPFTPAFRLEDGSAVPMLVLSGLHGVVFAVLGLVTILIALIPRLRVLNISMAVVLVGLLIYTLLPWRVAELLSAGPQIAWVLLITGTVLALVSGLLSIKKT